VPQTPGVVFSTAGLADVPAVRHVSVADANHPRWRQRRPGKLGGFGIASIAERTAASTPEEVFGVGVVALVWHRVAAAAAISHGTVLRPCNAAIATCMHTPAGTRAATLIVQPHGHNRHTAATKATGTWGQLVIRLDLLRAPTSALQGLLDQSAICAPWACDIV
jgi:hypothetical protein